MEMEESVEFRMHNLSEQTGCGKRKSSRASKCKKPTYGDNAKHMRLRSSNRDEHSHSVEAAQGHQVPHPPQPPPPPTLPPPPTANGGGSGAGGNGGDDDDDGGRGGGEHNGDGLAIPDITHNGREDLFRIERIALETFRGGLVESSKFRIVPLEDFIRTAGSLHDD